MIQDTHDAHSDRCPVNSEAEFSYRSDRSKESIAIIGIGCRFPGDADDCQSYWNLLSCGRDAIRQTPPERWNLDKFYAPGESRVGKTQSQWGGYVNQIDQFDPQLFGISPREAASMDPQQRMLLEVAWRALEDAGVPVEQVAGRLVSVFTGISSFDYAIAGLSYQDRGVINPYSNTGGSNSIAANRISYCFDLRGPSVAVDTACSSSLVAVHMACESLLRGDAELALAGGVNALLMPDFYVGFSQLGVLSPDGRCKTFDERANGYVRGEGAGMVLLKPLGAAVRDRDSIYGVICATALNQDGRTEGMTVPSQDAQESLLRTACRRAKIDPAAISYVEAHGTGTAVGDPIEANALAAVLCEHRDADRPCVIGSVKTNIGHLEAGAGIASLIKVALSLHHRKIPAHLNFEKPNPKIDLEQLKLRIPLQTEDWDCDGKRIAGVNGFGYGGANAHILVEEAPQESLDWQPPTANSTAKTSTRDGNRNGHRQADKDRNGKPAGEQVFLPVSARSKSVIASVATDMANWLQNDGKHYSMQQIASFSAHRRSHLECRAGVSGTNFDQWIAQLHELAESPESRIDQRLSPEQLASGVLFVCSGQGPQWWAMGRKLFDANDVFRDSIKSCDREFAKYVSWSLIEELHRDEADSRIQETSIAQPCIFALQVALAAVWADRGIRPTVVVGHSVGEIAAACLSGGLSWQDACCVAVHRGRTMDVASSQGSMIAAGLSPEETRSWIKGWEGDVSLAAINGPSSVTISGADVVIEKLAQQLESAGVFCRRLNVEYAFHSPQMEPVRDELLRSLANIQPTPTHTRMISTVTGQPLVGTELDADYWWKNVRQSVRFADAMSVTAESNIGVAIEVGPHPVLTFAITECFQHMGKSVRVTPSLHRQRDDNRCMSDSLASLYSVGIELDWKKLHPLPERRVPLPNYPFQRQACWLESFESQVTRLAKSFHPLLGEPAHSAARTWRGRIELKNQTYLADHSVRDACLLPAAAMIEMLTAAARQIKESDSVVLRRLRLLGPCILSDDRPRHVETTFRDDRRSLALACREVGESNWQDLAIVDASDYLDSKPWNCDELDKAKSRCNEVFSSQRLYEYCQRLGLQYEKRFQGITGGRRRDGEAIADVALDESLADEAGQYGVHPALLDSCFHAMIAAGSDFDHTLGGLYLPVQIREIRMLKPATQQVSVHVRLIRRDAYRMVADIDIIDSNGQACMMLHGFESQRVGNQSDETTGDLIYRYRWSDAERLSTDATIEPQRCCLFIDEGTVGERLAAKLRERGDDVVVVRHRKRDDDAIVIDAEKLADFQQLFQQHEFTNIVYLWGPDSPENTNITLDRLDQSSVLTTLAPMHLVQAWELAHENTTARLTIVTQGAQSPDAEIEPVAIAQGPLIGFGRVIVSEYSRLRSKLVDLPPSLAADDIDSLTAEVLASDDDEDEVMIRDNHRFVHRFVPQSDEPISSNAANELPSQLALGHSSGIDGLHYRTKSSAPLAAGEIEIEVIASGLNFSDVMKALDLYPGLPDGPVLLGAECSGRITHVADDVQDWKVGDLVMAVAPGSFTTHVNVKAELVARKPANLSHAEAATIPIAFLTAEYALNECARMRRGDSVLIHSASGGVGLAAMQLAQLAGATVFATAGNDEKREHVRRLGVAIVMDSRSLRFADETLAATTGEGVDIVLNSLPGEAIAKGLAILKTGGRFLEIGKRDIYADAPLGLHPFKNNLALFAIDLDQLFNQQPARMGQMLRKLVPRLESGELKPLPIKTFRADDTPDAFRFMQQGKHIGKIVVNLEKRPRDVRGGSYPPIEFHSDATYWLAGGLGGFGLEVAKWLSDHGAGSIVLGGRSQKISAAAQSVIDQIRAGGATVTVIPADITQTEDVRRVLEQIKANLPPLRGVFHTAMVLEDRMLVDLDRDTLQRVLRPKVLGGWNLHHETLDVPLDHFVLFSSLSSVFGHPGQANYSAANALLDSLVHFRRARQLTGCVMNFGHLGEVGYLAEREQLGERLERQGVLSFTVSQATDAMEYALQLQAVQLSVLRMDWSLWRGLGLTSRVSPRFAHLLRNRSNGNAPGQIAIANAEEIRSADDESRSAMVSLILRSKSGSLLGIDCDQIERDRPLLELGLDSLMAVEMRNWIESQIEINLPISDLMRSPSLDRLTSTVCEIVAGTSNNGPQVMGSSSPAITSQQANALLDEFAELSDDRVSELLAQMLKDDEVS